MKNARDYAQELADKTVDLKEAIENNNEVRVEEILFEIGYITKDVEYAMQGE